jgi:hypothetical protein
VGNVEAGALEALHRLPKRRRVLDVCFDEVMPGRNAGRDGSGTGRKRVSMALAMPPPRTMSMLAI